MTAGLEVRLKNDLTEIPRLAGLIEAFGDRHGLPDAVVFNLNLCLDELITNIVSYGYDDDASHVIAVKLTFAGERLVVEVTDDGRPFDPLSEVAPPDLDSDLDQREAGGLGVHFVRTLMDDVRYRRDGAFNRLTLSKRVAA